MGGGGREVDGERGEGGDFASSKCLLRDLLKCLCWCC